MKEPFFSSVISALAQRQLQQARYEATICDLMNLQQALKLTDEEYTAFVGVFTTQLLGHQVEQARKSPFSQFALAISIKAGNLLVNEDNGKIDPLFREETERTTAILEACVCICSVYTQGELNRGQPGYSLQEREWQLFQAIEKAKENL